MLYTYNQCLSWTGTGVWGAPKVGPGDTDILSNPRTKNCVIFREFPSIGLYPSILL